VITRAEQHVRARAIRSEVEIVNLCVPASGLADYRDILKLGLPLVEPDMVLVHYYAGNDGPDMKTGRGELTDYRSPWYRIRTLALARNLLSLVRHYREPGHQAILARALHRPAVGREAGSGAAPVPKGRPPVASPPEHEEPSFPDDAFLDMMAAEAARFLHREETVVAQRFAPVFRILDEIVSLCRRTGATAAMVIYPSQLQVDGVQRSRMLPGVGSRLGAPDAVLDFDLPNRLLASYAMNRGIPLLDLTPVLRGRVERTGESLYKANDTHWNALGNAVAGESEGAFIAGLLASPGPGAATGSSPAPRSGQQ
jgi:hypothetical protein